MHVCVCDWGVCVNACVAGAYACMCVWRGRMRAMRVWRGVCVHVCVEGVYECKCVCGGECTLMHEWGWAYAWHACVWGCIHACVWGRGALHEKVEVMCVG